MYWLQCQMLKWHIIEQYSQQPAVLPKILEQS